MLIFYVDDTGEGKQVGFSALGIHSDGWMKAFEKLRDYRDKLRREKSIPIESELHATQFIGGRGTAGQRVRSKQERFEIFNDGLRCVSEMKACLISAFGKDSREDTLFEWLSNRINRCAEEHRTQALMIIDSGKEDKYRALARRLRRYNPIPSRFRSWDDGSSSKNIPNHAIIEDVIFRDSADCYFIQAVDFCAYALLRSELPRESVEPLSSSYQILEPICVKKAFAKDPKGLGIIRA